MAIITASSWPSRTKDTGECHRELRIHHFLCLGLGPVRVPEDPFHFAILPCRQVRDSEEFRRCRVVDPALQTASGVLPAFLLSECVVVLPASSGHWRIFSKYAREGQRVCEPVTGLCFPSASSTSAVNDHCVTHIYSAYDLVQIICCLGQIAAGSCICAAWCKPSRAQSH